MKLVSIAASAGVFVAIDDQGRAWRLLMLNLANSSEWLWQRIPMPSAPDAAE